MLNKRLIAGIVIVLGVLAWYAFRPERLFIDSTVNESLAAPAAGSAAEPTTLAQGSFHSNAHETIGTATILSLGDGRRILRLRNFSTSNGPDVRVYLVAAPDVTDDETVKRSKFVELGTMKGNKGDQNYDVPATVDLGAYRTVTIWCKRFSVNFGSAPLSAS
jgi:Electron transfer DM13